MSTKPAEPVQKVAALPPVQRIQPQNDSVNAPIAMFSRHNGGWTVVFSIADPTLGISWRMGEGGDFRETGFMDTLDPRTRKRMPNPSIELSADAPAATIQVRYVDANGELQGPFPIRFDPEAALIRDQRKILDMLKVPAIDIAEVGAGGGSIAGIDKGGLLVVGPQSAGASPGPACYGLGNEQPTVTDANVVLGFINGNSLAGGNLAIDSELSEAAIRTHVGEPLGIPLADAAHGIRAVANAAMVRR